MRRPSRWMWMRSRPRTRAACCGEIRTIGRPRWPCTSAHQVEHAARLSLTPSAAVGSSMMTTRRAEGRGARHGHALALAARQRFHRLVDVLDGEQAESAQASRAPLSHRRAVEPPEHVADDARLPHLAAEEHVVGDRQRRRERKVLVHGLDAGIAAPRSASGSAPAGRRAGSRPLSGMTAPQSALISVDLPAPLSPMTPRISLRLSSKVGIVERHDAAVALDRGRALGQRRSVVVGTSTSAAS